MEYYSAIERNEIGSFVETWMDPETVIQSEIRKRKKNHILMHICGIQKNGTDEPVCKTETETLRGGRRDKMSQEIENDTYNMHKIDNQ